MDISRIHKTVDDRLRRSYTLFLFATHLATPNTMLPRLTLLQAKRSARSLSTFSSAVERLLEKKPKDVVVTFAKRTAMGRAKKGQLKDTPVDELLQALFKVIDKL